MQAVRAENHSLPVLMNPSPSNPRSDRAPPTTFLLTDVVPLSGESATAISSHGVREVPKWTIDVRSVVEAYVYMDSIFYWADEKCQLVDSTNRADERTLHERDMLERQGELGNRKFRPCVVIEVKPEANDKTNYLLCPMAGFHKDGSRQLYEDLEEPASLLARPVQTTHHNKSFGGYAAYQFEPEWNIGPQYLIPVQVPRGDFFVANHWLPQKMETDSFNQLMKDIENVSNVWKKWRNAEDVDVKSVHDIPVFKSKWDPRDWAKLSPTQWKAYPSGGNHRGRSAMRNKDYLALTANMKFTQETDDSVPFEIPTDVSTLSGTSEGDRAPLAARDALLAQDGHTPSQGSTPPYQADFPAPNLLQAPSKSKEMPESHHAIPSHLVPASSPRLKSLIEKDITPTEIILQSPHSGRSRHCDGSIQGRQAAGIIGDAPPELEASSDMDISSTSNERSSQLGNLAKRHSFRSSKTPNSPSLVRRDVVTPKVEVKPSHSAQHLSEDSVDTPYHDPTFLPSSDPIPVGEHILSEVTKVDPLAILEKKAMKYPWKKKREDIVSRGVKRARSPEDKLPAAGPPTKKHRTTQN